MISRSQARSAHLLGSADTLAKNARGTESAAYAWYAVVLLAVVNFVNYVDRFALSVLLPSIKADLHLTDGQLGVLVGLAFFLFYAACSVPIARWADRGSRRDVITAMLALWSLMTALGGLAQNYWQLLLARIGVGAGEAGAAPASQALIADYAPPERRSGMFAVYLFGSYIGVGVGAGVAGWLDDELGWRSTLILLGLPGLALALVVRLTLKEPPRGQYDAVAAAPAIGTLPVLKVLFASPTYRLLLLVFIFNGFLQNGLNQWWPSFYSRTFGLEMTVIGAVHGTALTIGSGLGLFVGGLLANRLARRGLEKPLYLGAAAAVLILPAVVAALFAPNFGVAVVMVGVAAFGWTVFNAPLLAAVTTIVAPDMRATASAVVVLVTAAIGFTLGPFLVGLLSDSLTAVYGDESLRYSMLLPACFAPLLVIATVLGGRSLKRELTCSGQ